MKNIYCIIITINWICFLFVSAVRKDAICEQCVKIEECPSFALLNKHEQQVWLEQVPCEGQPVVDTTPVFGFSSVAKGDYVCCPKDNIWENDESNGQSSSLNESYIKREVKPDEIKPSNKENPLNPPKNPNADIRPNQDYNPNPSKQTFQNNYGNQFNRPVGPNYYGNAPNQFYGQRPYNPQYPNGGYGVWNNQRQPGVPSINPGQIPNTWQNPYNRNPYGNGRPNQGDQCAAITGLPDPQTRCCGRDMSDTDRITDLQNLLNINAPSNPRWPSQINGQPPYQTRPIYRQKENESENDNAVTIDIGLDDRIAGGKETELDQFPWTTFLKMTFDHGNAVTVFSCGGSLISRQYVLTAGHCVFEPEAKLTGVNITLAEYDKTTFPRDCKYEVGRKPKCIDNVLMFAEEVILHPQYDDDQLHNDIALIRLQGYAPYTRYIRPVCLPPIDIDNDDLTNLPLAVAGWGRNGQYVSDIKQSTVVRLIPHEQCKKSYPYLSTSHLCAAGRTGQDTCKGDSGGPLMMMFRASYYVIGVVSGKRADSPCGSTVPSLYTNVFHYVPWIRSNIRN